MPFPQARPVMTSFRGFGISTLIIETHGSHVDNLPRPFLKSASWLSLGTKPSRPTIARSSMDHPKYLKHFESFWDHQIQQFYVAPGFMLTPPVLQLPCRSQRASTCWSSSPPPSKWFQDPNLRDCATDPQLRRSFAMFRHVSPISVADCGSTVELHPEWRHQRLDPILLGWDGTLWSRWFHGCATVLITGVFKNPPQLTIQWPWSSPGRAMACALAPCISESALKCLAAVLVLDHGTAMEPPWTARGFSGASTWFKPRHLPSMTSSGDHFFYISNIFNARNVAMLSMLYIFKKAVIQPFRHVLLQNSTFLFVLTPCPFRFLTPAASSMKLCCCSSTKVWKQRRLGKIFKYRS